MTVSLQDIKGIVWIFLSLFFNFFPSLQFFTLTGKIMWVILMSDAEGSSKALSHHAASISHYTPCDPWPFVFSLCLPHICDPWLVHHNLNHFHQLLLLSKKSQCFAKRTLSPDATQMWLATPTRLNCRYFVATTTKTGCSHCEEVRLTPIKDVKIFLAAISGIWGGGLGGYVVCLRLSCPSSIFLCVSVPFKTSITVFMKLQKKEN